MKRTTNLNFFKGSDGVAILPSSNFGLLVSRPDGVEDCDALFVIEKPSITEINPEYKSYVRDERSGSAYYSHDEHYRFLRIYSMSGFQIDVEHKNPSTEGGQWIKVLDNLPPGFYIVQFMDLDNKLITRKIFRQ